MRCSRPLLEVRCRRRRRRRSSFAVAIVVVVVDVVVAVIVYAAVDACFQSLSLLHDCCCIHALTKRYNSMTVVG